MYSIRSPHSLSSPYRQGALGGLHPNGAGPWWYDPDTNAWEMIDAQGTSLPYIGNQVTTYDSLRDRIWFLGMVGRDIKIWYFDIGQSKFFSADIAGLDWTSDVPYATKSYSLHYDSHNDIILVKRDLSLIGNVGTQGKDLFILDPKTGTLSTTPVKWPDGFNPKFQLMTIFYNPDVNAFYIWLAGEHFAGRQMWGYRYKR